MMHYMLAHQTVEDFDTWKAIFDSHAEAQEKSGIHVERILRNIDEPNELFIFFRVTDVEGARDFTTSDEVPEAQEQSSVTGETKIYLLEE